MIDVRPFQRRFLKGAFSPRIRRAALSLPRGNGKSHLAAYILRRALTPGDPWHVPGSEYLLLSGSLEQARQVFNPLVAELPHDKGDPYRVQTSTTRLGAYHRPSETTLRVVSSKAKTAFGLGANNPIVVCDEPGAWETVQGEIMNDALDTAIGKPDAQMRLIYIGTLAPSMGGWWPAMIETGSTGSTYVQALIGDADKWDQASEIRRVNPLMWHYPDSRQVLLEERDAARSDTRLRARFMSYRLNLPSGDESVQLLNTGDWLRVLERPIAPRDGQPVVGIDLGGGRAWSAAVAIWRTGRVEAIACAPGIPDLPAQERRDRVPGGTYQALHDMGQLRVCDGKRVQPPAELVEAITDAWGQPLFAVCDRFRENDLRDAAPDWDVDARVTRWSEASADIRALRRMSLDGDMNVDRGSADLLTASLAVAMVKNDDAGNVRLVKKGMANTSRDDVAAALTLVAGAIDRHKPWDDSETPAYSGMVAA